MLAPAFPQTKNKRKMSFVSNVLFFVIVFRSGRHHRSYRLRCVSNNNNELRPMTNLALIFICSGDLVPDKYIHLRRRILMPHLVIRIIFLAMAQSICVAMLPRRPPAPLDSTARTW